MHGPTLPADVWLTKSRQLAEVSRSLTSAMGVDEVMQFAASCAASLLDTDRAILLTRDDLGLLTVRASVGIAPQVAHQFEVPLIDSLDPHLGSLFGICENQFLGVPLVVGGEISGILAVARGTINLAQEEQEFLLSALADQAAIAIQQVQLSEAARFRERLIGIVSHDLRTPITAISLIAQSLLRKEMSAERVTTNVLRIQRSAERASRMIRDLLDFTQFHLGAEIPLHRKPLQMADIVDRCIDEVKQVHPARQVTASHQEGVLGHWDSDRLEQAVGNILANALAYSPKGSQIRITTWQDDSSVLVRVHNEGTPIAADRLPHIFEPMQRGNSVPNAERSVGLGLYIVKNIVTAHKGKIAVSSSANDGTTVTLELPCEINPVQGEP